MSVTDGGAQATTAPAKPMQHWEGRRRHRAGPRSAGWWASVATTCFLALLASTGLSMVVTEVWRNHPYDFLHYWAPVTAVTLLAVWHLASASLVPLWLFGAYETGIAFYDSVTKGHVATGRIVMAGVVLAWVAALAWKTGLRPVRTPTRSTLAVVGLALMVVTTCYGTYEFGAGVFNPWTTYPTWSEEPGARDGLGNVTIRMVRSATAMDNTRFTLTYALTPWDAGRRLSHGQADYLAHVVFCREMSGAEKDGRLTFGFEFVDKGMAPLNTSTMTAQACHRVERERAAHPDSTSRDGLPP